MDAERQYRRNDRATRWRTRRPEAVPLHEVVKQFLIKTGLNQRKHQGWVEQHWAEAAGEAVAAHTRVVEFKGMVLRVQVDSSALLGELVGFHRDGILEKLRAGPDPLWVREVRFELSG